MISEIFWLAASSKTSGKLQPGFGPPLGAEIKAGFIWKTAGSQAVEDHAHFVSAKVTVYEYEDGSMAVVHEGKRRPGF